MPTPTASQPDPQWYIAKMRDLYERDPQLLDPSWRAYFSTESAPPQLRAKRPDIPEGTPSTPDPPPASSVHAALHTPGVPLPANSSTTRVKPSCLAARIPVSASAFVVSSGRTGGNPSTLDIQLSVLIGLVASKPGSGVGVVSCAVLADAAGEWEALDEASAD